MRIDFQINDVRTISHSSPLLHRLFFSADTALFTITTYQLVDTMFKKMTYFIKLEINTSAARQGPKGADRLRPTSMAPSNNDSNVSANS